ncbi:hypothetical protein [Clostridium scatologenes]|uniref:Uncharacterized protein n=1 Tax=Clostridium scatologenes TaxID=1548 RepID=A0A0E3M7Y7_CLOSL|nr:hypothetical protein [Clostridium scatologenes]AKA71207.1 hypothetical protein CSCA_4082 [Clostridium scatologenes]
MKVLERLKLELSNRQYFSDTEYTTFLSENNLNATNDYDKAIMQRNLLLTVLDVLEALSNDVDMMRKLNNDDIMSASEAYKYLDLQKQNIKQRIAAIPIPEDQYSNVSLLFTKNRR